MTNSTYSNLDLPRRFVLQEFDSGAQVSAEANPYSGNHLDYGGDWLRDWTAARKDQEID